MASKEINQSEFLRGFAVALSTLARQHGQPSMAADIAVTNGITLADLRGAGVEKYDLEPLIEEMSAREKGKD